MKWIRTILGWFFMILSGLWALSGILCIALTLTGQIQMDSFGEGVLPVLGFLLLTVTALAVFWYSRKWKNGPRAEAAPRRRSGDAPSPEAPPQTPEPSALELLKGRCHDALQADPGSEEAKTLLQQLGQALLELDEVHVLMDEDFDRQFPFIGSDGRIEICSRFLTAHTLSEQYRKEHLGHTYIRSFTGKSVRNTLRAFAYMGIHDLRLDNGAKPVDLRLKDLVEQEPTNLLEITNTTMKGCFLRELQYSYRITKSDPSQQGSSTQKSLTEMMLTMRFNGYRALGNGLCYVLAPTPVDTKTTYYTPKALARAKKMLVRESLSESALIADGDDQFGVYDGPLQLRVARKPDSGPEDAMICAFTGQKEALAVRKRFASREHPEGPLVITYDELAAQAACCAGVVLDMPSYGLEIQKNDLPEVLKWRDVPGLIVIQLGDTPAGPA